MHVTYVHWPTLGAFWDLWHPAWQVSGCGHLQCSKSLDALWGKQSRCHPRTWSLWKTCPQPRCHPWPLQSMVPRSMPRSDLMQLRSFCVQLLILGIEQFGQGTQEDWNTNDQTCPLIFMILSWTNTMRQHFVIFQLWSLSSFWVMLNNLLHIWCTSISGWSVVSINNGIGGGGLGAKRGALPGGIPTTGGPHQHTGVLHASVFGHVPQGMERCLLVQWIYLPVPSWSVVGPWMWEAGFMILHDGHVHVFLVFMIHPTVFLANTGYMYIPCLEAPAGFRMIHLLNTWKRHQSPRHWSNALMGRLVLGLGWFGDCLQIEFLKISSL